LKAYVGATLPRSTRQVGAWIEQEFGLVYESRSGLIALLHRLGLEYHKPNVIPTKLDEDKQRPSSRTMRLLNSLGDDEAVLLADAVHPTHAARPAGCWAPKKEKLAIEQTSGRSDQYSRRDRPRDRTDSDDRGRNCRRRVDDQAPDRSRRSIRCWRSSMSFLTTRYHHARLVQEWLARPGCRIKLHSFRPIARISIRSSGCGA
jgi:hypothetical protein